MDTRHVIIIAAFSHFAALFAGYLFSTYLNKNLNKHFVELINDINLELKGFENRKQFEYHTVLKKIKSLIKPYLK